MSYADKVFKGMCRDILDNGVSTEGEKVRPVWEDTNESAYTIKKFGVVNRYDLRKEFPALTLRRTALKSAFDELLWIWQKKSNNVNDLNARIWDQWADEQGTIVAASDGTTLTWNMSPSESWQAGEAEKSQNTEKSEKAADSQNNAETDAAVSNPTDQTDGNSDVIVHITKTGEKYHSAGCQYLRKSDIEVTLSEAKARGLTPCSKCNPPQ